VEITFHGERMVEEPTNESATKIIREQQPLAGAVIIDAEPITTDVFRINVHIENRTPGTGALTSYAVMPHSFVSTHAILQVHQGTFISLLDPPEELKTIAQGCHNVHTWPVLVGNENEHDKMLSSPIILYDYPQIAPESPGSLFDGTEIDEILTLRIMTLADEEKEEMRQGDERAREILERTESLSPEQLMKLHGVIRNLRPVDEGSKHEQHE
jgi:hydrogenase maturation protease